MAIAILISILYGVTWGALWGILEGSARKRGILAGKDPLSGLASAIVWGGIGYFVALFAFGAIPYSLVGLVVAIPLCIVIENRILKN